MISLNVQFVQRKNNKLIQINQKFVVFFPDMENFHIFMFHLPLVEFGV